VLSLVRKETETHDEFSLNLVW